jgi:hypothetical protein
MAITKPKQETKADPFASGAPDARPVAKLRGKKRLFAMTLPPDLMEAVDRVAAREDRSRAKMVEIMLRRAVQEAEHAA